MAETALAIAAGSAFVAILAVLLATGTAIRLGRLEASLALAHEGLKAGSRVPREAISQLVEAASESEWLSGPSLIAFVSPGCDPCRLLIEQLNRAPDRLPARRLFVEPDLDGATSLRELAAFEARWVSDGSGTLRQAFQTFGTPHLFMVRDGLVSDQHLGADAERIFASG